jgi:hypothetical protein
MAIVLGKDGGVMAKMSEDNTRKKGLVSIEFAFYFCEVGLAVNKD